MPIMPVVCRICLRSDKDAGDTENTLVEFHFDLCENDVVNDPPVKFCQICEYQLKKFYNFRQKCRRSNNVLKAWIETNIPNSIEDLHTLIPPSSITCQTENAERNSIKLSHTNSPEVTVKLESDFPSKTDESIIAENLKLDFDPNINNLNLDLNLKNIQEIGFKEENLFCEDFNDDFDDDDDYKPLSETIKKIKKKKPVRKIKRKHKEKVLSNSKRDSDGKRDSDIKRDKRKNLSKIRDRILELMERGELQEIGDNVTMNKELFLEMFDKCNKTGLRCTMSPFKPGSSEEIERLSSFLLYLLKKNNPEYAVMFDIEHLDTYDKKLDEFKRRQHSKEYLEAEFKCDICYKIFEVPRLLDYHRKWHEPSTGSHVCDICAMRFARQKSLAQHLKDNHCAVYRCKLCPQITYSFSVMVNHFHQHKGKEYSCPICLSVFSNKSTMNNHRLQAHKTSHICALCARCFVSEKGLYFHKRLKHKDETATKTEQAVSCDKCNAILTSAQVLHAHIRQMHSANTIHKCFHCKEIFSSLEQLKKHKIDFNHQRAPKAPLSTVKDDEKVIPLNTDDKPFCEECNKSFNTRKSYLRHFNLNHNVNRIHKCGFCQAKFTSSEEIEAHRAAYNHHLKVRYVKRTRKNNTGTKRLRCNKPFEKCDLCDEMVATSRVNAMYQHFQASHPDIPYTSVYSNPHNRHLCEECGKTFKDLRFFLDHKNLHTGAKPYPCTLCSRSYATKRHLSWHMERHGPPRHQCKECGKMFNSAGNLFAHRRGHVGDRRFKCEICAKGFLHQAALNEHVRGVHNHIRRTRKCREK